MDVQYPVLVEGRQHYLLWVEAESAEEAARQVNDDPDYLSQVQPYDSDWTATAPDADDYSWTIYGHGGAASRYDAHIQAHRVELYRRERAEKVAACAMEGHLVTTVYSNGDVWCKGCTTYVKDA
jgi:hypothetical protein